MEIIKTGQPFLAFLQEWYSKLPAVKLKTLLNNHGPAETALLSIDVLKGFCSEGNLASPRVGAIVQPIVDLFKLAEQQGMNHYVLLQDSHPPDSKEFEIYPPHCGTGTEEAKTVPELQQLPHFYKFRVFPKTTIDPGLEPEFVDWLQQNDTLRQFIVVGDCTDICVYQLAMLVKMRAVKRNVRADVIVPANAVDTFDIALELAREKGLQPHPADFLHAVFLYHMHLNGIRVVARIE